MEEVNAMEELLGRLKAELAYQAAKIEELKKENERLKISLEIESEEKTQLEIDLLIAELQTKLRGIQGQRDRQYGGCGVYVVPGSSAEVQDACHTPTLSYDNNMEEQQPSNPATIPLVSNPDLDDSDGDSGYFKLRVIGFDLLLRDGNNEIHFRLKMNTQMGRLKKSYADRLEERRPIWSLRFLFDGRRINDEMTPEELELKHDDVIEVHQELLG